MRALRRAVAVAGLSALFAGGLVTLAEQPASAAGTNRYVAPASASPAGLDSPTCGASATPCRTIAYTYVLRADENDIINVRPGTYTMTANAVANPAANTNTNRLSITKSMTIQKDPGSGIGAVILDGASSLAGTPIITLATANKVLTLGDLTIRNGVGTFGGAITLGNSTGTTVNATNVVFQNHVGIVGGAIDVGNTGTYTQTGGSFTGNTAGATANGGLGGAVFVTGRVGAAGVPGSASFTNVTFSGNRAIGGPTANTGNGGALWNAGLLSVSGGTFGTNGALQGTAGSIRGFGGAIFNGALDADDAPSLSISSTTINGGLPSGTPAFITNASHGGGIANLENATGVASAADSTLTATGLTINGTTSAFTGGGIRNGATATLTGGAIQNASSTQGGGLALARLVNGANAPAATLTNVAVNGNTVTNVGGGIIVNNALTSGTPSLDLNGGTVSSNTSLSGGGVYVTAGSSLDVTGTTLANNTVTPVNASNFANGGAIHNLGSTTLDGATLSGNTVTASPTSTLTGLGGAIYNAGPTLSIEDSTIDLNTANGSAAQSTGLGGGIYDQFAAVTIDASSVTNNTAVGTGAANTGLGGGLFTLAAPVQLTDTVVDGNDATGPLGTGGGFYNAVGNATITGGSLAGNTATFFGGGLVSTGPSTLTDVQVQGNDAAAGGGIFNTSTMAISGTSSVSLNTAVSGAGISSSGTLIATGLTLDGNTATAVGASQGLGGGLLNSGTASLTLGSISGNKAISVAATPSGLGGGAFNGGAAASLMLDRVTLSGNSATPSGSTFQTGWGGAVYNGSDANGTNSDLTVDRSTFDGNTAVVGSAVLGYTPNGTNDATIRRSTISANGGLGPVTSSLGGRLSLVETTYYDNPSGLLLNGGSTTNLSGSIVHVAIGAGCAVSGGATVASGGYDLARTGDATCGFSGATDDVFGDPQLGPLALNGGTTRNHLPGASSPALDQVPGNFDTGVNEAVSGNQVVLCDVGDTDQRGTILPQGARCDIGSVEAGQVAPDLTGPSVGTFTVGSPGELAGFSATGSPTPTLSAVGLPAGLTLVSTGPGTAKISGTPAAGTGGAHNVTVTATNEAGSDPLAVTLTVNEAPTVAGPTTVNLIETIDGDAATYTSTGFPVPTLSLTGSLPAGVSFTPGPNGTGTIDGAPAAGTAGTYNVTVVATNGTLPNGSLAVTINVVPRLTITTTSLPNGQHGVAYNASVAAIGGTPPYAFSLDSGSLPAGLTLTAGGTITGTPTGTPGTATFTVEATDSSNPVQTDTQELSITIERGPTVLTVSKVLITTAPFGIRFGVVDATLRGGLPLQPIPGQQVTFKAGAATLCTATTDANGFAGCSVGPLGVVQLILAGGVTATYAGNAVWLPATGSAGLL